METISLKELLHNTYAPIKKTVSFRCDVDTLIKMKEEACENGMSLSSLINNICENYYK